VDDFTVGREPPPVVGASDDIVPVVVIVDIDGREPAPVVGGSDDIVPVVVVIITDDGAGIIVNVVVIVVGVGVNVAIVGKFGLVYDTVGISVIRTVVGMAVGDTDGLDGILSGQLK
jgi:hypothetical protein